jgi:hypothetical protein
MSLVIWNYQASFDLFVKDLQQVLEFIEPVDANKAVFSHRIYGLLLRVCTDFESLCKDLLIESGYKKPPKDMNVYDYRTLETNLHLDAVEVDFLLWRPRRQRFSPFSGWTASDPPLRWYGDYNMVKHNRDAEFSKACLNTLIESGAGIFCLIAKVSNFDWGDFCSSSHREGKHEFWRSPFEMFEPE